MKAKSLILVACATVAMFMSSCGLRGLISSVEKIAEEEEEIMEGKLFTTAAATITYADGTVIQFEKNGKIQYLKDAINGDIQIYDGEKLYYIDVEEGTYREQEATQYYPALLSNHIVMEATYEFGDHLDKYSTEYKMTQGTKTIAGQSCKMYTITDGDDKDVICSWNRVMVYESNDGEVEKEAVRIENSVAKSILSILKEYKIEKD